MTLPPAPLGRRTCAWLIDAALGCAAAVAFAAAAGGAGDVSTLVHLVTFKSVNGDAGRRLSQALHPGSADLAALRPILGLMFILTVIAVGAVVYRVGTTAVWGAGIGKWLLGLRVVVDAGAGVAVEPPGWGRAWRRWLVPQGTGLIPLPATGLLAYLPVLRDSRRRGLHDRAAGTLVVDVRR
jgi:uncharacterized RDD family membrane protein YckC